MGLIAMSERDLHRIEGFVEGYRRAHNALLSEIETVIPISPALPSSNAT